jgi:RNA polymerase sigma-70 factor (ECF subfamily)
MTARTLVLHSRAVRRPVPAAPAEPPDGHRLDVETARRCVKGDPDAQRAFVETYTGLVYSICRRSGVPRDDADDVCQDVFRLAFLALPRYRGESRLTTWLYVLARRRVTDYFRSPCRRQVASGLSGDPGLAGAVAAPVDGPEDSAIRADGSARLRSAVETLGEPMRSIVVAYYLAEMPVREIARELGLREANVKTQLHRARAILRTRLEPP